MPAARMTVCVTAGTVRISMPSIYHACRLNTWRAASRSCYISRPGQYIRSRARGNRAGHRGRASSDRFERDTIEILKRLSRRPIDPRPDSELLADLGFDSLQVLELVGELEDHFNIAVPLNSLTHIRTVGQIAAEVRRLVAEPEAPAVIPHADGCRRARRRGARRHAA